MKKTRFVLASAALLLLALGVSKNAAADATITITGAVSASSCTVVLNPTVLNLGNHQPGAFTAALTPVAASARNFTIELQDCSGTAGAGSELFVVVTGITEPTANTLFMPSGASGNVGVMLSTSGMPTIANGTRLPMGSVVDTDFTPSPQTVSAGLATTDFSSVTTGSISVPITFNYLAP